MMKNILGKIITTCGVMTCKLSGRFNHGIYSSLTPLGALGRDMVFAGIKLMGFTEEDVWTWYISCWEKSL